MANDPDALFPSGPTTRRGLFTAFGRRAAEAMPASPPAAGALPPRETDDDLFYEELPAWIDPVLSGEALIDDVRATEHLPGMHIWWLGQSGFLVRFPGETVLVDPYLSETMTEKYAGTSTPHDRRTGLAVDPALLSFVDVVLATNAHLDHLDPGTLPHVLAGNAAYVCPAGSEDIATERAGRPPDETLAAGYSAAFGGFWIEGVPAHHADAPEAVGYVVRNGAYAFYHAGDSRRVEGMAEAVALSDVDAAFLPINGTDGNMNGTDAARLAYEASAHVAIPCHHQMFRCEEIGTARFVAECARLRQQYRLPRVGERITIDFA